LALQAYTFFRLARINFEMEVIRRAIRDVVIALVPIGLTLCGACGDSAAEATVRRSYAACKDPATVEQFEGFERRDDDQGYKRLYLSTAASRECISFALRR
jgi:hypothetical protein